MKWDEVTDATTVADLAKLVTAAQGSADNTKKIVDVVSKFTKKEDAGAALSLLINLDVAAGSAAEYKKTIDTACGLELIESDLLTAFYAADNFYSKCDKSEDMEGIYKAGFDTCMKKYLASEVAGLGLTKLTNSEL